MKKIIALVVLTTCLFSCKNEAPKSDRNIVIGDTITTETGLKYIFLKEGNGRKIEPKSQVKVFTDLYINESDTTIWTTRTAKDSTFNFVHQKTSLIKGFTELHNYLVEGDKVIAILPYTLAYGEKGRGSIPPKATLVYNPLEVRSVSEPKEVIADTLYHIIKNQGVKEASSFYDKALNGEFTTLYHTDLGEMRGLFRNLVKDSLYIQSEQMAGYFLTTTNDEDAIQVMKSNQVNALEQQGKIKEAIAIVTPLADGEKNKEYWQKGLKDLQEKLKQ